MQDLCEDAGCVGRNGGVRHLRLVSKKKGEALAFCRARLRPLLLNRRSLPRLKTTVRVELDGSALVAVPSEHVRVAEHWNNK